MTGERSPSLCRTPATNALQATMARSGVSTTTRTTYPWRVTLMQRARDDLPAAQRRHPCGRRACARLSTHPRSRRGARRRSRKVDTRERAKRRPHTDHSLCSREERHVETRERAKRRPHPPQASLPLPTSGRPPRTPSTSSAPVRRADGRGADGRGLVAVKASTCVGGAARPTEAHPEQHGAQLAVALSPQRARRARGSANEWLKSRRARPAAGSATEAPIGAPHSSDPKGHSL